MPKPWIVGYGLSHNGAVCLLHGDRIVAAIQEERLNRMKRSGLPGICNSNSLRYCLEAASITLSDVDLFVGAPAFETPLIQRCTEELEQLGVRNLVIPHHLSHAYAAWATSGFSATTLLIVDGSGSTFERSRACPQNAPAEVLQAKLPFAVSEPESKEIVSLYRAESGRLEGVEMHYGIDFPDMGERPLRYGSLGAMFSTTAMQAFNDLFAAGKLMGLAPYGVPRIDPGRLAGIDPGGALVFHPYLLDELRQHEGAWPLHEAFYQDVAASLQVALETVLERLWRRARDLTGIQRLAYAGGVALNSVANERLIGLRIFEDHYIMPAAEDSGTAIGAAYYGLHEILGWGRSAYPRLDRDACGRSYPVHEIEDALRANPFVEADPGGGELEHAIDLVAAELAKGKIVGWFNGQSELGPRALGQRSILCDPRLPDGKRLLNERVKHREGFRPFAPAVLAERAHQWFESKLDDFDSPFMLRVLMFQEHARNRVPSVVHVDGSGRIQTVARDTNPRFHRLLSRFEELTGLPILLNTSFNVMGEPIVESPDDALWGLIFSELDLVFLDGVIARRRGTASGIWDLQVEARVNAAALSFTTNPRGERRYVLPGETRWGPRSCSIKERELAILQSLNDHGRSGCASLLERMRRSDPDWSRIELTRGLAKLHRAGALLLV